jgi:hypothetical protein
LDLKAFENSVGRSGHAIRVRVKLFREALLFLCSMETILCNSAIGAVEMLTRKY